MNRLNTNTCVHSYFIPVRLICLSGATRQLYTVRCGPIRGRAIREMDLGNKFSALDYILHLAPLENERGHKTCTCKNKKMATS